MFLPGAKGLLCRAMVPVLLVLVMCFPALAAMNMVVAAAATGEASASDNATGNAHPPLVENATEEPAKPLGLVFKEMVGDIGDSISTMDEKLDLAAKGFVDMPENLKESLDNLTPEPGMAGLGSLIMPVLLVFVAAGAVEWLARRATRNLRARITEPEAANVLFKFLRTGMLAAVHALYIGLFIGSAMVLIALFMEPGSSMRMVATNFLVPLYRLRLYMLCTMAILGPVASRIRLVDASDQVARHLYNWIFAILAAGLVPGRIMVILTQNGLSGGSGFLLFFLEMLLPTVMILYLIWSYREPMSAYIRESGHAGWMSRHWHWLATGYVVAMITLREFMLLMEIKAKAGALLISFVIVPVYFALDRVAWSTLVSAMPPDPAKGEDPEEPSPRARKAQGVLRTILGLAMVLWFLDTWGLSFPVARVYMDAVLSVFITLIAGWFIWESLSAAIDAKLKHEGADEDEEFEEGGAGGSRKATLLTLLKKALVIVMVVITAMIILASLGVDIGPILAGAGIFGLAIGFGAQALVRDIFSGIFFLIDDAFRIGDYVESGKYKGTVEHISVRSLRLRHPRGMVMTIPFGGLGAITNYSRDWCIMKLDIRVPFDTDIDKVRKIIKKIGKRFQDDPELGPKLLSKIKSQGVKEIDDSALVTRVKFKTKPGNQFVLRREIYKSIQKDFAKNGITFAPRKVIVDIPDLPESAPAGARRAVAAAADTSLAQRDKERRMEEGEDK